MLGFGACYQRLTRNVKRVCNVPLAKGVGEMIYLGMKDEQLIAPTYDSTNALIVTALGFKTNEKLFAYEGRNYSNQPSVSRNESDFDVTYPQVMTFLIFSNDPAVEAEIMKLDGRQDLICVFKRVSGYHKIMGLGAGMRVTNITWDPNADNKGAWVVTLTANDEINIPHTLLHKTSGVDDTAAYLQTIVSQVDV